MKKNLSDKIFWKEISWKKNFPKNKNPRTYFFQKKFVQETNLQKKVI